MRVLAPAILTATLASSTARAELAPHVAPMTLASDDVCELLKSDRSDRCRRAAQLDRAKVYQAGTKQGIRRYVLAIDRDADTLISPAIDLPAEDGTLDRSTPTVTAIQIDGHPGFVLDVVSSFHRGTKQQQTRWQTETLVGCNEVDASAPPSGGAAGQARGPASGAIWKCVAVETGACAATVEPDGSLTTSCGDHLTLSTRR